jgi:hypothetical protein
MEFEIFIIEPLEVGNETLFWASYLLESNIIIALN